MRLAGVVLVAIVGDAATSGKSTEDEITPNMIDEAHSMRTSSWIVAVLCVGCARAAHPSVAPSPIHAQAQPPAEALRLLDVRISKDRISVPDSTPAGTWNISFFNATSSERTASLERDGEVWKLERAIPPDHAVAQDFRLMPGDYKIVSGEGRSRMTAILHVTAQQ